MTNFTRSIMFAAAALTLAGAASAQSLKADIPFAFNVGNKLMQPGIYDVHVLGTGGVRTYRLLNTAAREAAVAMPSYAHNANKEWKADGKPRLAFECGASRCSLSELWSGDTTGPAYKFPTSKSRNESMRVAVIVAEPTKAE